MILTLVAGTTSSASLAVASGGGGDYEHSFGGDLVLFPDRAFALSPIHFVAEQFRLVSEFSDFW